MIRRARTVDYYHTAPEPKLACGDIWSDLPSFGLLPMPTVRGIVVTPACDLANGKTETVTYLPIVSFLTYFTLTCGVPVVLRHCLKQLRAAGLDTLITAPESKFLPPRYSELSTAYEGLATLLLSNNLNEKTREACERARAGVAVLQRCWRKDVPASSTLAEDLERLMGKEWPETCTALITNSHSAFLHFLPRDNQPSEYSAVPDHSLALFRYPITVPAEVMYRADDVGFSEWQGGLEELRPLFPIVDLALRDRPLKRSTLRKAFTVDLMARYMAVYNRVGVPSFGRLAIEQIVKDLRISA